MKRATGKKQEHVEVAFLLFSFFQVFLIVRDQRQEAYKPVAASKRVDLRYVLSALKVA
jgi:hypothetical protein